MKRISPFAVVLPTFCFLVLLLPKLLCEAGRGPITSDILCAQPQVGPKSGSRHFMAVCLRR